MDEFLKMDVFFLVTTLVVIVLGFLSALILFRLWKILGHVEHISEHVAEESDLIREDITHLRNDIKSGASKVLSSFNFFKRLSTHGERRKRKKESASNNVYN